MEFISYESPAESRSRKKRQSVRKHVTKRQHRLKREAQVRREAQEKIPEDDDKRPIDEVQPSLGQPEMAVSRHRIHCSEEGSTYVWKSKTDSPSSSNSSSSNQSALSLTLIPPRLPPQVPYEVMLPCHSTFNTLASFIHATMIPAHVSALHLDPMESQVASSWFTSSSITEPALYTSALLTAAPHFKGVSPDLTSYLRGATITSLVEALADDQRRQNPALILAVECLTFYECLYCDQSLAQQVHRPAMRRLIQAHGGRDNVEVPIAWKKVSLMADIVMEIRMGSEGESSFLRDEKHGGGSIMEGEWTEALRLYLPDVEDAIVRGRLSKGANGC